MTPDPIDARLEQLRRLGGDKLVADLIDLFGELAPQRLAAVRAGLAAGDAAAVALAAHSLTSSAGNLGLAEMQALAADLERCREDDARPGLARRLEEAWAGARAALAERRKGLTP